MDEAANLSQYKVQLSTVELTLANDPENEDLLKLKKDLLDVIELTEELMEGDDDEEDDKDSMAGTSQAAEQVTATVSKSNFTYSVNDKCMAPHPISEKYCEATIQDVFTEANTVVVKFPGMKETEMCPLSSLKPFKKGVPTIESASGPSAKNMDITKKQQIEKMKEYKKKRNLKKKMRLKEKEAESEVKKSRWMDFNKKAVNKKSKGRVKKSIFASPIGLDGKVGVGTCGVADKQMTKFEVGAKYNARHLIPKK